jgi:hypothetical protein
MELFGTQDWDTAQVKRVIDFERAVARALPNLLASMASASDYAEPERYAEDVPSDAPFALARAAELAFVTDQFKLGVDICIELLSAPYARPKTVMQIAQWAAIGVAFGVARVHLDASGAKVSLAPNVTREWLPDVFRIPWPPVASRALYLAQRLIPAAVASGNASETVEPLLSRYDERSRAAVAMIELSDEFAAALSLDKRLKGREGVFQRLEGSPSEIELKRIQNRTFETLEFAYSKRLTAMRRTPMWNTLRVRGNLIDWSLLLLWIARFRRKGTARPAGPRIDDIVFVRDLAKKLIKLKITI